MIKLKDLRIFVITILSFSLLLLISCQSTVEKIDYLGQQEPGMIPQVFAPGIISLEDRYEFGSVFSKDGNEFFFAVEGEEGAEIFVMDKVDDTWTDPKAIISDSKYGYNDPFLSPDEERLYFISPRPVDEFDTIADYDIWYVQRTDQGWSEPLNAGTNINTNSDEYYISFTQDGDMYFASSKAAVDERRRNFDIYRSAEIEDGFDVPVILGKGVNSDRYEADVFVAPDESYVIFCSIRKGGSGIGDLYISYKDEQGNWTPAQSVGDQINTKYHELCPFVSHDGRFLFYTSNKDIYWVSMALIHQLRPV